MNLSICAACPEARVKTPQGKTGCAADPQRRDVWSVAEAHECPLKKHPRRGLGDGVKRVLDATGVGPLAKRAIAKVTGKPCKCGERQALLNRVWPRRR